MEVQAVYLYSGIPNPEPVMDYLDRVQLNPTMLSITQGFLEAILAKNKIYLKDADFLELKDYLEEQRSERSRGYLNPGQTMRFIGHLAE